MGIDPKAPPGKYPKVTKRVGASPPQYPDSEDEESEDDDVEDGKDGRASF